MRQEVLTGAERRRRWSDSEKRSILGEVGLRGSTVAEVARRHDLTRQHIYQWRAELRLRGESLTPDVGTDGTPQFREAACWAHLRRDFHDVWKTIQSEIAREALDRIGALYDIEAQISGRPAAERHAVRQEHSRTKAEAFHIWAEEQLRHISGKGDLARAFRYALNRWPSFCLFLSDGRVAIDNNPAERAMRPCWNRTKELALRRQ
jgi:transposase-like protein